MTQETPAGLCPNCGTTIPRHAVLIEYEQTTDRAIYADCSWYNGIVRPE